MAKKKVKSEPQKRKSRAKYPYPPELKEMVRMVSLVPYTVENFVDFDSAKKHLTDASDTRFGKKGEFNDLEFIKSLLSNLPEDAQNLIKAHLDFNFLTMPINLDTASEGLIKEVISCYKHLSYLWFDMRQYITQRKDRKGRRGGFFSTYGERLTRINAFIEYDENNNEKLFGFAGQIGKFNGDRLRICEIDSRIFWAKREDSKTCSSECLNKLNVRRHRALTDEEKAKKKEQREANKSRNKKLKQLKEKKNVTLQTPEQ